MEAFNASNVSPNVLAEDVRGKTAIAALLALTAFAGDFLAWPSLTLFGLGALPSAIQGADEDCP